MFALPIILVLAFTALGYTVDNGDGTTETTFIAPVYDDDGEIDDIMTVRIGVEKDVDEEAGMARDDAISEIVNTLKVDD